MPGLSAKALLVSMLCVRQGLKATPRHQKAFLTYSPLSETATQQAGCEDQQGCLFGCLFYAYSAFTSSLLSFAWHLDAFFMACHTICQGPRFGCLLCRAEEVGPAALVAEERTFDVVPLEKSRLRKAFEALTVTRRRGKPQVPAAKKAAADLGGEKLLRRLQPGLSVEWRLDLAETKHLRQEHTRPEG